MNTIMSMNMLEECEFHLLLGPTETENLSLGEGDNAEIDIIICDSKGSYDVVKFHAGGQSSRFDCCSCLPVVELLCWTPLCIEQLQTFWLRHMKNCYYLPFHSLSSDASLGHWDIFQ